MDDYRVHQIPEPLDHVGTSDRNFYERYYFKIHNQTGEVFAIIGLGQHRAHDLAQFAERFISMARANYS